MSTAHNHKGSDFAKHAEQFRTKASSIGEEAQDLGELTKKMAKDTLALIGDNAEGYYKKGIQGAHKLEQKVESKIKTNPVQALLIATGVGVLLGVLFRKWK